MRTVIHEMRNQLAVAVANIEAFIDGKLEPTPGRLRAVLQALGELEVLTNDLRAESPPYPMLSDRQSVNICTIITNEILAIEATALEKGVTVVVHRCPRTRAACRSFSDPQRIGQAVKNLLLNAVRYTPPGGTVTIDCYREAAGFGFAITNSGSAIATDDLARIFEPAYRGSGNGSAPGSGMGLTVAKRLIEDHGGTISVANSESRGVTFTVRLPDAVRDEPYVRAATSGSS
jgi:signal transduction histidine kinase